MKAGQFWSAAGSEAPRRFHIKKVIRFIARHATSESGAEATAVQTLREEHGRWTNAERLDCGAFTAALAS
jgi:hypothetical protein